MRGTRSRLTGGRECRRRGPVHRAATLFFLAGALVALAAPALAAQNRYDRQVENRMLREASTHAVRGELRKAEATLRELLELQPRSSAAVLALERVLRADDRLAEILPAIDAHVAAQPFRTGCGR